MISLDTGPLVYVLCPDDVREDERETALNTIAYVDAAVKRGTQIIIPAQVVAEYLAMFVESSFDGRIAGLLGKRFMVAPYDMDASLRAAAIWRHAVGTATLKQLTTQTGHTRQRLKCDFGIVATSVANRATEIVTTDTAMATWATPYLKVTVAKHITPETLF